MKAQMFTRLAALSVATTLGTAIATADTAQAATLTYEFNVDLTESLFLTGAPEIDLPPLPDYYDGFLSFDASALTGVGLESIGIDDGLEVSLTRDPRVNQDDDERFPDFPVVNFQDGEILGLDWEVVYHPFTIVPELGYPGDFFVFSGTELTDGFDPTFYTEEDEPRNPVLGFGTVSYAQVPEPSILIGLSTMALGLAGLRKKQKQSV